MRNFHIFLFYILHYSFYILHYSFYIHKNRIFAPTN